MAPVRGDYPFQPSRSPRSKMMTRLTDGQGQTQQQCSVDLEMSALIDLEMSSFGVCSYQVDRTTRSGGGDAELEPQGP